VIVILVEKKTNLMDFAVKTSLGILFFLVLVYGDIGKSNINFNERCEVRKHEKNKIDFLINHCLVLFF